MDSSLKYTDAVRGRDKEFVGVGALAMALDKNQKLPVSDPSNTDDYETHNKKASAITRKGAQAAISYMITAGLHFSFLSAFFFFLDISLSPFHLFVCFFLIYFFCYALFGW
jgi:hypothetical protein